MLQVKNIEVVYMNVIRVLRGISLTVADGQIVALLGANGGGKTTTLKAISGIIPVGKGRVSFLGENITWHDVDDHSAQVTFTDCGKSVSGLMIFDDRGRLTNFTTKRYREIDGEFSLDPWSTPITGYGVRAGLNLPVRGQAVWSLPAGDLPYADLEITDVEYNSAGVA